MLFKIVLEFGIHMKLIRLIKMCLNDTYSRVWVGKSLSDIRNGLKQGDALPPLLLNFAFSV
jgi:methionine aminopeptidase